MRREYKQFKMEVTDLIRQYFFDGFTRNEILCLLHSKHSITLSIRRLKNYLRSLNLRRHTSANTVNLAYHAIENEIRGSGSALGYRSMTQRLASTYGIIVPRSVVSALQRELDPRGVEERRRRTFIRRAYINKGPNYLIHIDGYDKLKRYGFPIHGAIDGMSSKLYKCEHCVQTETSHFKCTHTIT